MSSDLKGLLRRVHVRPKLPANERAFFLPVSKPSQALMKRHYAAMQIIERLHPTERISLLAAVVAPSSEVLRAQTESLETKRAA